LSGFLRIYITVAFSIVFYWVCTYDRSLKFWCLMLQVAEVGASWL